MKISNQKRDKIYEQILVYLYSVSPKALFTINIAMNKLLNKKKAQKEYLTLKDQDGH